MRFVSFWVFCRADGAEKYTQKNRFIIDETASYFLLQLVG